MAHHHTDHGCEIAQAYARKWFGICNRVYGYGLHFFLRGQRSNMSAPCCRIMEGCFMSSIPSLPKSSNNERFPDEQCSAEPLNFRGGKCSMMASGERRDPYGATRFLGVDASFRASRSSRTMTSQISCISCSSSGNLLPSINLGRVIRCPVLGRDSSRSNTGRRIASSSWQSWS